MLNTRNAVEIRSSLLPKGAGTVSILRLEDGRIVLKRFATRGKVLNVVDRRERAVEDGRIETLPLDELSANRIVNDLLAGKPWSDCFLEPSTSATPMTWEKSEAEHKYTSTGQKFWRHRGALESYRAGTGRTIISTHISPEGACNLRCPYCSVTHRDTHSRIALHRIKQYVTDLKSRGLKAVIFTGGGEPTLYPDFNELVQWTEAQGLSVALITNGTTSFRVLPETWKCFSWIRVSINVFDDWQERIRIPHELVSPDCVIGASFVYSVEHEALSENVPLDRVEMFRQVAAVATRSNAKYVRILPNCLLTQERLVAEHRALKKDLEDLNDSRFFQQFKVHGAPQDPHCHQSHFRPYLSEEPFHVDGEPGTVYPCDSVVLNDSAAHFAHRYQICKPEGVLDFLDGEIEQRFDARTACTGCVFTGNVDQLGAWKEGLLDRFAEFPDPLVHEEFV